MWVAASKSPIFAHSAKRFIAIQVRKFVSKAYPMYKMTKASSLLGIDFTIQVC